MKFTNYLHDPSNDIPQIVHQEKTDPRHKDPLRQAQTNRSSWPDFSAALKNYEHLLWNRSSKNRFTLNELTDFMELKISHYFMAYLRSWRIRNLVIPFIGNYQCYLEVTLSTCNNYTNGEVPPVLFEVSQLVNNESNLKVLEIQMR